MNQKIEFHKFFGLISDDPLIYLLSLIHSLTFENLKLLLFSLTLPLYIAQFGMLLLSCVPHLLENERYLGL